jgi:hypothetical protein
MTPYLTDYAEPLPPSPIEETEVEPEEPITDVSE